jgi:ribosomal protein L37AE/L43A
LHPEVRDPEEVSHLQQLSELGVHRCPRCQLAFVKEGGCHILNCGNCKLSFLWAEAEQVVSPTESRTAAQAVGIGESDSEEDDIYLYDHNTGVWVREVCELDDIRGRQTGRRYVRKESSDRPAFTTADDTGESFLMAFIQTDRGEGAETLAKALDAELDRLGPQSATTRWDPNTDPLVLAIREGRA